MNSSYLLYGLEYFYFLLSWYSLWILWYRRSGSATRPYFLSNLADFFNSSISCSSLPLVVKLWAIFPEFQIFCFPLDILIPDSFPGTYVFLPKFGIFLAYSKDWLILCYLLYSIALSVSTPFWALSLRCSFKNSCFLSCFSLACCSNLLACSSLDEMCFLRFC